MAAMTDQLTPTERTTVRRLADRGRFDRATVNEVIDEAYIAHVGFVIDAEPRVLPMTYGRVDDVLYLHGAVGNAMLRASTDAEVCVTITLARRAGARPLRLPPLDELPGSVVLLGTATKVEDDAEKRLAFDAIVEHVLPGRSQVARPATESELRKTLVLRLPIEEGSAKVRTGGPLDDDEDMDLPVWAGVVPLRVVAERP